MFNIPNQLDAPLASSQAEPDSIDFAILAAAHGLTGVVSGCAVTPQGAPDMTVAIAAGEVAVAGVKATVGGANVPISAADPTNPRFDLIVSSNDGTLSAVVGTAGSNPVFPSIPADSLVLAAVYVPANETAIESGNIVDKRVVLRTALVDPADPDQAIIDLSPAAWWRVDGGSYSDAGTTLAVADDPIWQINDKSGNARHMVQATLAKRPLYKTAILNGKAVGRFDGVDDWMQNTFGSTLAQPNTIYIVGKATTANKHFTDGISGVSRHFVVRDTTQWHQFAGTSRLVGTTDSNNHIFSAIYNTTTSTLFIDGAEIGAASNAGTHSLTGITVGANYLFGSLLAGDIAELIVFDALHNATQRADVESRLADFYGITLA